MGQDDDYFRILPSKASFAEQRGGGGGGLLFRDTCIYFRLSIFKFLADQLLAGAGKSALVNADLTMVSPIIL